MAEGRNRLFFCEEQGCKNYGSTTRGSLKRKRVVGCIHLHAHLPFQDT